MAPTTLTPDGLVSRIWQTPGPQSVRDRTLAHEKMDAIDKPRMGKAAFRIPFHRSSR